VDDARTRVSFPLIADHVLLGRSEGVEAADAAASATLTGNVLTQILAEVPDALLVDSERPGGLEPHAARERYHRYLMTRLEPPRAFLGEAVEARVRLQATPPRRRLARR